MKRNLGKFIVTCFSFLCLLFINQIGTSQSTKEVDPCGNAKSTLEMRKCFSVQYTKSNNELNQTYSLIMKKLDEKAKNKSNTQDIISLRGKIIDAQRAWINFRDKSCEVDRFLYRNGSFEPIAVLTCLYGNTTQRVTDLKGLLEEISR
jgi:uncharacterized protein YecT (DUF1311 family)